MFAMKSRKATDRMRDTAAYDDVTLADGTTVAVVRGNLVAAKALLAAQKAAERRVAGARQQREAAPIHSYTAERAQQAAPLQDGGGHKLPRREQSRYRIAAAGATDTRIPSKLPSVPAHDRDISAGDGELRRIALPVALPCALGDCGQPTSVALIEPDPSGAGLWYLLPVCADGANHTYADAEAFGRAE